MEAPVAPLSPDVLDRLGSLAEQWALPPSATGQLAALLQLVASDPRAPTAVREPSAGVDAHIADSLTGLVVPDLAGASRIADLGAGGGFPGLPLAIARPDAVVSLVESNGHKCEFIERAAARTGAGNARAVRARAEEWVEGRGASDAVTARALARLAVLVEYAAPLLRDGGVLVAWKGRRDADEEAAGARAAEIVGLEPESPIAVEAGPAAEHRHLHVFRKVAPTPPEFPRRAGMARKRPLA
jgi:16S rRNA (guanine527-N7)-methyltransferase